MTDDQTQPSTMLVHEGGTPAHVQITVRPRQSVVDYLDADGNLLYTVVHDTGSIEKIAKTKKLKVEVKDHGGPPPTDFAAAAAARTKAEAQGTEIPPDPNIPDAVIEDQEPDLSEASRDELYEMAQELDIDGRSTMDKEALLEAVKAKLDENAAGEEE